MNYTIQIKAVFLLAAAFLFYLPSAAYAQMQTGSAAIEKVPPADCGGDCQEWSYVWQYFDFSEGKTFSEDELGTYTPDIKGSSNEGINFGQEFDSNIPQYRLLLLEGVSFDEEITVPEWNEGAPWVTTSWEATGYQPIETGQIWAVYTQEGHYTIVHITDLPNGVWGTSFTFDYKYLDDGSRVFAQSLSEDLTLEVGQYFDFSEGKAFSSDELETYTPDIKGSSNEGINFGQEFDSNIPQYRLLLLEGVSFDEEITVPEWTEGAPWVTTSWEATGYQPIEAGQIWAVYTQEEHYAIMQITDLPDGVWGSTFIFKYKYQNDGSRVFGGTTGEEEEEEEKDPVYYLNIYSGNEQSAEISSFVPETLKVRVTDENTQPVSGVSVAFAFTSYPEGATSYGGLNELSITDSDGIAYSDAKLGELPGEYVVTATLQDDPSKTMEFILTATEPEVEYQISIASGNNQQVETGTQSQPLQVLVTDQNDTPLSGEIVKFSVHFAPQGATGMHFNSEQVETDANGLSTSLFTVGDIAGEYIVKASLDSDSDQSVFFTLVANTPTPDYFLTRESTDHQVVSINSKFAGNLLFRLKDVNNNPVNGAQINFSFHSVPDGAEGYGDIPLSMTTGAEGYAFLSPRVGNLPGEYVIRASMGSHPEVFADITLVADIITLQIVNGNSQMALPGTELPSPLEVAVKRDNGDFITGKTIKFEEFEIPEGAESGSFKTIDGITVNQVYILENTAAIKYTIGSKPGDYVIKASDVNSEFEPVYFNIFSYGVNDPDHFTATAGSGIINLSWSAADGAAFYNIYRSSNGNDFQSAYLITSAAALAYTDMNVTPGQEYYYWIKSVDELGNIGTNNSAPVNATPDEITEPEYGTGMIIATSGSGFSKTWQYFDFSAGAASNDAETENFVADIRGTSNEGVNFGNENAAMIEGRRLLYLGAGTLEEYASMDAWTNESPWIFNSWDFSLGTGGQPLSEGSVWGIYTSEGHYAMMEVTSVPAPHGDTLAFRYKYQPSGSPIFGHQETPIKPDSIIMVSGNNQTGAPGKPLSQPINVKVIDAEGNGVAGHPVFFRFEEMPANADNYTLSSDTVMTDFEGNAHTLVTLGSVPGTYTIIAEAEGLAAKVTFTATAETLPAPTAVTLLKITQFRPNSLMLIWSKSTAANFSHYQVYQSTDNKTFTLAGSTAVSSIADTSISIAPLESMTEYFFKVAVVGTDEQVSEYSNVMSGTAYPKPAAPANITVTIGDGTIQLGWNPQDDEYLEYYYVMAGLDGQAITPRDTVWNLEKPLSLIRNLTNGETYQFYVIAVNKFGMQSDYSSKIMAAPKAAYTERQSTVASLVMGGLLTADIDNDGDNDLFITGVPAIGDAPAAYLYLNDGKGEFTDSGQQFAGVTHPSLYFLDIDFNGFLDLILIGQGAEGPVNKIYLNQEGKFTDSGIDLPLLTDAHLSPADYDNDGDMDLLITGESAVFGLRTILVKNNGGKFELLDTPLTGLKKASASWADYNGDGNADLLMAGENSDGEAMSIIYTNNGDDTFTPTSVSLQGVLNGEASWLDFNMDGKPDVLLSGYTNTSQSEFYIGLYLNTGSTFDLFFSSTSVTGSAKTDGQMARSKGTIGDYDNDGDPDALISAILGDKASATILKNHGDSVEEEELPIEGNATAMWADIDGDGDLDIIITGVNNDGTPASKFLNNTTDIKNTPPTVPSEFVTIVSADSVTLAWAASTDAQSPVFALSYNVRIGTAAGKSDILSANADLSTGKLKVLAPGNAGNRTSMILRNLANGTYYWQVQAVDNGFMASAFGAEQSFVVSNSTVANEAQAGLPLRFALQQNYPNPFNPATVIAFSLPHADEVVLEVFDITGRLVATLINGHIPAGHHSVQYDARSISSGIYIYRMRTKSGNIMSKKMTLIK